jgi:hypothetical protein
LSELSVTRRILPIPAVLPINAPVEPVEPLSELEERPVDPELVEPAPDPLPEREDPEPEVEPVEPDEPVEPVAPVEPEPVVLDGVVDDELDDGEELEEEVELWAARLSGSAEANDAIRSLRI